MILLYFNPKLYSCIVDKKTIEQRVYGQHSMTETRTK